MNKEETALVLGILYAETDKELPKEKIEIWAELLRKVPVQLGLAAAKRMISQTKIYGVPQFSDYRNHVNQLYRDARRAAIAGPRLGYEHLARMTPDEREAYLAHQKARDMLTKDQARAICAQLGISIPTQITANQAKFKKLDQGEGNA